MSISSKELTLEVVLMCRDRVQSCLRAIESIVNQTDLNFRFVVSDNSVGVQVAESIRNYFPLVNIIQRGGHLSQFEHMVTIIKEAQSDYLLVTHDDDILFKNFVATARSCIGEKAPFGVLLSRVVSYKNASNPRFSISSLYSSGSTFCEYSLAPIIRDYLIGRYFSDIYAISMTLFNVNAALNCLEGMESNGNHADACFIIKMSACSGALLNYQPVGFYEISDDSISRSFSLQDFKLFVRFLRTEGYASDFSVELKFFKLRTRYNFLKGGSFSTKYKRKFFMILARFVINPLSFFVLLSFAKRKIQGVFRKMGNISF